MSHYKKITEEILHANPWWRYKHDTYQNVDGSVCDYYYAETYGMVMLVPILQSGQVVMVSQYRYLENRISTEFPGGAIKEGQDVLAAAADELLEETGCVAGDFVSVGAFEPDNGFVRDKAHVFIAEVSEQREPKNDRTEERIDVLLRYPDEIEEMVERGDIWDGETLATWCLVRKHLLARSAEAQ